MLCASAIAGFLRIEQALIQEGKALEAARVLLQLYREAQQKQEGAVKRWVPRDVAVRKLGSAPISAPDIVCQLCTVVMRTYTARHGPHSLMERLDQLGQRLLIVERLTNGTAGTASHAWYEASSAGTRRFVYRLLWQDSEYDGFDQERIQVAKSFFAQQRLNSYRAGVRYQAWGMYKAAIQDSGAVTQQVCNVAWRVDRQDKEGVANGESGVAHGRPRAKAL
ncbi:hypothetical protein BDU57DRAFT_543595 [Ampelomyces quisqualis]|uniref:Uncharacterized protein n=1 Tax=Ampelomyces quisqualis TaxID=50730 RepID=A0A6A5Q5K8_AMPQU|nr:hypothetical protein BDU57DRAFT_543595 [Ampelomyces quisqualis]